jgi:ribonuclease HI
VELGGHAPRTTNNEMELKAVVEALVAVARERTSVALYTDSKYVVDGATGWIYGWQKNGWQTKAKTDIANKALWQALLPLLKQVSVTWHKIPGHSGLAGNERVDVIASTFAEKGTFSLYNGPKAKYNIDITNTSYDTAKAFDRSDARKRSAQKAHSYVSVVDGIVRTHATWTECEARVKGQKGACFKKSLSFKNEQEIVREFGG